MKSPPVFRIAALAALSILATLRASAFEPPSNSDLVVSDDFDREELGKEWTTQTGSWTIKDGALHGAEIAPDKHIAAARRTVTTGDAVYEMKFRFTGTGKSLHFGFDPIRGSLDKKGHLFSVIVTRNNWKIMKHLDKNKPKEDPDLVLATAENKLQIGVWYHLRVTTWKTTVKAMIEGIEPLNASDPSFGVNKPTLVFRASGDGIEIDNLRVWKAKQ